MNYDSNQKIPAFGFGAKTKFDGKLTLVNHCFPLSGNINQAEATGIQGLMNLYKNVLNFI